MWNFDQQTQFTFSHFAINARKGRLMGERGAGGWAAGFWTGDQYIQVDLGSMMAITMVATQGRRTHNQWVTKYSLSYSLDGNQWEHYKEGCVKVR
ncbi:Contactin-associated protein like 5-2 [Exaiptasia diaphana]|nr:Contactin-associated protein like 5-2 [Exaiptasia diaphana]